MTPRERLRYEIHPLADLFPRMGGAEFDSLKDDIKANGLLTPIVMFEGQILDGRHRYEACQDLGIDCASIEFDGADPVAFVLSANVHRRHLPAGQVGAIVTLARQWGEANQINDLSEKVPTGNLAGPSQVLENKQAVKQAAVAKAAGISERTLRDSEKVGKADKALLQQVAAGEVSLPKAVEKITGKRPGTKGKGDDVAALHARIEELESELEQVREGAKEAVEQAEAAREILEGDPAKKILQLKQQLRIAEQRRDELMRENAELKASVKALNRKVGKK